MNSGKKTDEEIDLEVSELIGSTPLTPREIITLSFVVDCAESSLTAMSEVLGPSITKSETKSLRNMESEIASARAILAKRSKEAENAKSLSDCIFIDEKEGDLIVYN